MAVSSVKGSHYHANPIGARNNRQIRDQADSALALLRRQRGNAQLDEDLEVDDLIEDVQPTYMKTAGCGKQSRRTQPVKAKQPKPVPAQRKQPEFMPDRYHGLSALVNNMGLKGRGKLHDPKAIQLFMTA